MAVATLLRQEVDSSAVKGFEELDHGFVTGGEGVLGGLQSLDGDQRQTSLVGQAALAPAQQCPGGSDLEVGDPLLSHLLDSSTLDTLRLTRRFRGGDMTSEVRGAAKVQGVSPCFVVRDVFSTAEYYRDVLGFDFDTFFGNPPSFVIARRDGTPVMLKQIDGAVRQQSSGQAPDFLDAYFWVDDLDALVNELHARGADIVVDPTDRPIYQGRDLYVRDCDGRVLCFGQLVT